MRKPRKGHQHREHLPIEGEVKGIVDVRKVKTRSKESIRICRVVVFGEGTSNGVKSEGTEDYTYVDERSGRQGVREGSVVGKS